MAAVIAGDESSDTDHVGAFSVTGCVRMHYTNVAAKTLACRALHKWSVEYEKEVEDRSRARHWQC